MNWRVVYWFSFFLMAGAAVCGSVPWTIAAAAIFLSVVLEKVSRR